MERPEDARGEGGDGVSFTVLMCEQGSPEWFTAKAGRVGGSEVAEMLATLKSGKSEAAGRRNLRARKALERVTGRWLAPTFKSQAMQDGTDREAAALSAYEALTGRLVERSGFFEYFDPHTGEGLGARDFSWTAALVLDLA